MENLKKLHQLKCEQELLYNEFATLNNEYETKRDSLFKSLNNSNESQRTISKQIMELHLAYTDKLKGIEERLEKITTEINAI